MGLTFRENNANLCDSGENGDKEKQYCRNQNISITSLYLATVLCGVVLVLSSLLLLGSREVSLWIIGGNPSCEDNTVVILLLEQIGGLLLAFVCGQLYQLKNSIKTYHRHDYYKYESDDSYEISSKSVTSILVSQIILGLIWIYLGVIAFFTSEKTGQSFDEYDDKNHSSWNVAVMNVFIGVVFTILASIGLILFSFKKPSSTSALPGSNIIFQKDCSQQKVDNPKDDGKYYDPQLMRNEEAALLVENTNSNDETNCLKQNIDTSLQSSVDKDSTNSRENDQVRGIKRMLELARPQQMYLVLGCLALLIRLPFSLAIPHFMSVTLGELAHLDFHGAKISIFKLFVCALIDGIFDFWCVFLYGCANLNIVKHIRIDTFRSIIQQEMAFFDSNSSGELASRLNSDCGQMGGDLTWFFRFSVESVVRIIGIITYMLVRCPTLGLCTISIVPFVAWMNRIYGNWLHANAQSVQTSLAEANSIAQDALSCIRTVIAFATEDFELQKYTDSIENNFHLNIHQLIAQGLYYMIVSNFLMNAIVVSSLLFIGGILIERDKLSADILLAFMLYQTSLQSEIQNFFNAFTALIRSAGAGEKVFSLMDRKTPLPGTGAELVRSTSFFNDGLPEKHYQYANIPNSNGIIQHEIKGVTLENVCFAYPTRSDQIILNNLNLHIKPGSTVALVGASGCGKSTIMGLLQRFYEPISGRILVDGKDLKEIDLKSHRQSIGTVTQDPVLFSGTIISNLTYGCQHDVSMENILEAAKLANAHEFIQDFPEQYNTQVGERGIQLSGGQKQRIAIARALVKKPSLLLLDEATSALDSESEKLVQEALDRFLLVKSQYSTSSMGGNMSGITTIIIAHRLATIQNADCIAVMKDGKVAELGNHSELLSSSKFSGIYRKMVEQASLLAKKNDNF